MPDNKKQKRADSKRISLKQPWERRYWTRVLGVTLPRLRAAVAVVGTSVRAVREYLKTDKWANGEVLDMRLSELV